MKFVLLPSCAFLLAGATAFVSLPARAQTASRVPIIIPRPAVPDGSNWSRAPFPAERRFDDVQRPNGYAVDLNLPPNTPATDHQPLSRPAPRLAIFQPRTPAGIGTATPMLAMTGRPAVSVSAQVASRQFVPTIRGAAFASREQVLNSVEARLDSANTAMKTLRDTTGEMSVEGRNRFMTVDTSAQERESAVRNDLKAARGADEQEWTAAREQLAADYEAYASALAQVDVLAGNAPAR